MKTILIPPNKFSPGLNFQVLVSDIREDEVVKVLKALRAVSKTKRNNTPKRTFSEGPVFRGHDYREIK